MILFTFRGLLQGRNLAGTVPAAVGVPAAEDHPRRVRRPRQGQGADVIKLRKVFALIVILLILTLAYKNMSAQDGLGFNGYM
jgi:hypothetical protein